MSQATQNTDLLKLLHSRRSVMAKDLCEPGPTQNEVDDILRAAHRVPDHKKLGPWRFVVFSGDERAKFGELVSAILSKNSVPATPQMIEFEKTRFTQAPTVIAVISSTVENEKAPEQEQVLSAGAACQNILLAATALGYGAQWLSEWYSYDKSVHKLLEMKEHESVAGFFYIGSYAKPPKERERPDLESRVTVWQKNNG